MPCPTLENRPGTTGGTAHALLLAPFILPWSMFSGLMTLIFGVLRLRRVCTFVLVAWGRAIVATSRVRVVVHGREHLKSSERYFFLSNHQSALDIPVLFQACGGEFHPRFMAKESLFKIPFFGWGMRGGGFIPIRRESARHSAEMFKAMQREFIRYSYINFPEGTRSEDGRLQPFKRGAIGLALRLKVPIVPVTIIDACRANPKARICLRPGTVHVVFHEPVQPGPGTARDELMARLHATIGSALPEEQKARGSGSGTGGPGTETGGTDISDICAPKAQEAKK